MPYRFIRWHIVVFVLAAVVFVTSARAADQSAQEGGRVSALPRSPDGKPDLSGVWQTINSAAWNIQDHNGQLGVPPGEGVVEGNEIPYQPWAAAKKDENFKNRATADPESKCYLPGVPRITYMPHPFQIVQTRDHIAILYEYLHAQRIIYTDGRPHLPGVIDTLWLGDSIGRWEGDSLVVDIIHFNNESWFDRTGNFHSEALHVIERYTPMSADHIQYEVTIEDPKVFTRPWKMTMPLYRRKESRIRLLEYECVDYLQQQSQVSP